jgi:hypothetical protein
MQYYIMLVMDLLDRADTIVVSRLIGATTQSSTMVESTTAATRALGIMEVISGAGTMEVILAEVTLVGGTIKMRWKNG